MTRCRHGWVVFCLCLLAGLSGCFSWIRPQRTIDVRDPSQLPKAHIPEVPPPQTVAQPQLETAQQPLSLDEALRISLANTRIVRILQGVSAVSSGRTIYDPAISNTFISEEQGRFDPSVAVGNTWDHNERPLAVFDPTDPDGSAIAGLRTDSYNLSTELKKTTITGGTATLSFNNNLERFKGFPGVFALNPENEHTLDLGYTQPLLRGGGIGPNLAPIVIARIGTEISYFQLKGSMQDSVHSVIDAYWALVFARTNAWARRQQVEQGEFVLERAQARLRASVKGASRAEVAQAESLSARFRADSIGAEAEVLQREAALKNLLGLPPTAPTLVPISPPSINRIDIQWDELVRLAEERRPDLIELKLIILADEQRLLQAKNDALPQLDAVSVVGWNGMEGRTLIRTREASGGNEFTDWTLGVNFSVPLGLRQGRAILRRQELILARDRANLDQGLHSAMHDLAISTRNLAQFYQQYEAYKAARVAARANLEQQAAEVRTSRAILLNLLQAITDWGNAVSLEAQSLAQYNAELANLERKTGTILETHGVQFFEERFASIGPLGRLARPRSYPKSMPPGPNADMYPTMSGPAENFFDLQAPVRLPKEPVTPAPPALQLPSQPDEFPLR